MMALKELIENLLDDDEGISSEAYSSLLSYLASIDEMNLVEDINNRVQTTNGRYYFPKKEERQAHEAFRDFNPVKKAYTWKNPNDPRNW